MGCGAPDIVRPLLSIPGTPIPAVLRARLSIVAARERSERRIRFSERLSEPVANRVTAVLVKNYFLKIYREETREAPDGVKSRTVLRRLSYKKNVVTRDRNGSVETRHRS